MDHHVEDIASAGAYAVPPYLDSLQRVSSFAEIQEVMRSPDFRQGSSPERDIFLGGAILMMDGPKHIERKKVLSTIFSREAMIYFEARLLDPMIDQVMSELRTSRGPDGLARADLVPLIRIMLHRISARVGGVDGVDTPARTERFRMLISELGEAATGHWSTRDRSEVIKEGRATVKALVDEFLQASLDRRRELVRQFRSGNLKMEDLPRDALTMICLQDEDTQQKDDPYNAYVWRETSFFLIASTQTTTHMLPHVVVHLENWIRQHPEDAAKIHDTAFLRQAVGESLRLHQTAPAKMRVATRDVTLSTGRKVAKDEMVALFAPVANLDTEIYGPDAAEFNPYRKIPSGVQPWGLTFGAGPHVCLGRSLVMGMFNRPEDKNGTEGTMVKILKVLYSNGLELDTENSPRGMEEISHHDALASVPIILRKL